MSIINENNYKRYRKYSTLCLYLLIISILIGLVTMFFIPIATTPTVLETFIVVVLPAIMFLFFIITIIIDNRLRQQEIKNMTVNFCQLLGKKYTYNEICDDAIFSRIGELYVEECKKILE